MADRPNLLQKGQFAIETTSGTLVPATKRFVALDLRPTIMQDRMRVYGTGDQHARGMITNSVATEVGVSGTPSFDELSYLLSLYLGTPTITTPASAILARQSQWLSANGTVPTPRTMTYEWGDANHAQQAGYVFGRDITINFARGGDGMSVTGTLQGRGTVTPFTLTAGATDLPYVIAEGVDADIYVDTTFAGLGTTKLTRAFGGSFTLGGLNSSFMALNSTQPSFAGIVPTRPDSNVSLRVGADATGLALASDGVRRYVSLVVNSGNNIDAGIVASAYRLTIDCCLELEEPGTFDDESGLLVIPPRFAIVHDATAGFAFRIQVVNTQTAIT